MRDPRKDLILGRMALFEGLASQSQIDECVGLQAAQDSQLPLGRLLVERGVLTEAQLEGLLERQAKQFAGTESGDELPLIGRLAIERRYCTPAQIHECLREQNLLEQRDGAQIFLGQLLLKRRYIDADQFIKLLHQCEAPDLDPLSSDDEGEACLTPDLIRRGQLGKYQILHEISRGGMGVVYKARHRRLGKEVALKVLKPGKLSQTRLERFRQEGRLVAQLSHRNIVQLYDWDTEDGIYYYTMEHIEGLPLDLHHDRRRLDERQAAALVAKLAHAVHYAHERGIIHRDLKPANILIDAQGEPHLTDFGLAKSLLQDLDLTRMGQALGTPSYMPPEQARGDKSANDQRSDVYSLGAILYELLSDQPPFAGINPFEYYQIILEQPPEPLRTLNPRLSEAAVAICECAMAKAPEERYPTARAMAEDLEALAAGEPVRAGTRRRPLAAGLLLALAAVAGGLWLGRQLQQRRRDRRVDEVVRRTEAAIDSGDPVALPRILDHLPQYGVPQRRIAALRQRAIDGVLRRAHQAVREKRVDPLEAAVAELDALRPRHPERTALQGALAGALVDQAEGALAAGRRDEAQRLIERARAHRAPDERWRALERKLSAPVRRAPRGIVPRVQRTGGRATWTTGAGTVEGAGGETYDLIHLGEPGWKDYTVRFELRVPAGTLGLFLRGGASGCQFPDLLGRAGVRRDPGRWYRIVATARGEALAVEVETGRTLRSRSGPFRSGLFGFAVHPRSRFQVRKLRVEEHDSR